MNQYPHPDRPPLILNITDELKHFVTHYNVSYDMAREIRVLSMGLKFYKSITEWRRSGLAPFEFRVQASIPYGHVWFLIRNKSEKSDEAMLYCILRDRKRFQRPGFPKPAACGDPDCMINSVSES